MLSPYYTGCYPFILHSTKLCELIFDVNSAYFYNHGGYEFAKHFYADAYQAAIKIVGGEQYIVSAVMHADERNRGMSEALGEDVYHYHLHIKTVQENLGHATASFTLATYAHATPEMKRESANRMDAFIKSVRDDKSHQAPETVCQ